MRIDFNISKASLKGFDNSCEAALRNVDRGTKAATIKAVDKLLADVQQEVPVDTGTLRASIFGGVTRRHDVKRYLYMGVIGFGEPSDLSDFLAGGEITWLKAPNNRINPKTGSKASAYAVRVHEDLSMRHPNGGKAKFLEDPVRRYAADNFTRTAVSYWSAALSKNTSGTVSGGAK